MAYEKLRKLLEKIRESDPYMYDIYGSDVEEEIENTSVIKWHKYPDEKPKENVDVLISDEYGKVVVGYLDYHYQGFVVHQYENFMDREIVHWSYLPNPPK